MKNKILQFNTVLFNISFLVITTMILVNQVKKCHQTVIGRFIVFEFIILFVITLCAPVLQSHFYIFGN